ncbi:hypothetical protein BASA81_002304 [Batrachochytrium salamandrivorans]|nr:hypothetical protein BASA81_002304 [Batrachochytrium salamandrivorans]
MICLFVPVGNQGEFQMNVDEEEEEIAYELPPPPGFLPKRQANWAPMSASSTRFAMVTLRKSSKLALLRCKSLVSTLTEGERMNVALDRVSRQVKQDMMLEQVPKPLQKDRRSHVLEDMTINLEQMSKKRKISVFMETYLLDVIDEKQDSVSELEQQLNLVNGGTVADDGEDFYGTIYPSQMDVASRANRALPESCARKVQRPEVAKQDGQADAANVFLSLCVRLRD